MTEISFLASFQVYSKKEGCLNISSQGLTSINILYQCPFFKGKAKVLYDKKNAKKLCETQNIKMSLKWLGFVIAGTSQPTGKQMTADQLCVYPFQPAGGRLYTPSTQISIWGFTRSTTSNNPSLSDKASRCLADKDKHRRVRHCSHMTSQDTPRQPCFLSSLLSSFFMR